MERTININLGGSSFCMDESAHEKLQKYLQSVEHNLGSDTDKKEVMDDIEARIAELLSELRKTQHRFVVSAEMVQIVIDRMGSPDDFMDEQDKGSKDSFGTKSFNYAKNLFHRHLYRDTDNQMIAGVCAGLAHWFGISVVWIRLIFVLCLFLWGFTGILYIIFWLAIPEARTAAQRLDMRGENATVENIEQEIRSYEKDKTNDNNGCSYTLLTLLKVCLWVVGGFVLFIACMVLFGVITALCGAFSGLVAVSPVGIITSLFSGNTGIAVLLAILLIIVIGIPIVAVVYSLVRHINKREGLSSRAIWIGIVVWILAFLGSIAISIKQIVANPSVFDGALPLSWNGYDDADDLPLSQLAVMPFHSVEIRGAADVQLIKDDQQYVEATVRNDDRLIYEVNDEVLTIVTSKKGECIIIHTPELQNMTFSGAAKIKTQGRFTTPQLAITASGASEIDLDVDVEQLEIKASGASDIELDGTASRLIVDVTGASKVDAGDLQTCVSRVTASGASNVEINVNDTLIAYPSGMSKITYHGTPFINANAISGGKIKHKK